MACKKTGLQKCTCAGLRVGMQVCAETSWCVQVCAEICLDEHGCVVIVRDHTGVKLELQRGPGM